jgi:L-aminopeptidase/D-esterase-like protein
VGAGTGATAGTSLGPERCVKGGIGTASERTARGLIAGALAAVNPMGDVIDERGRIIAGPLREDETFDDTVAVLREGRMWQPPNPDEHNTVLVAVATNAALTKEQANRLATVCHDGLARAVRPAHTPSDGDTIFALATGAMPIEHRDYRALEVIASLAVERAIRRGVTQATGLGGVPAVSELRGEGIRRRR